MLRRIDARQPAGQDADRPATGFESRSVGGAVNPARQAGDHGVAGLSQPGRQPGRPAMNA